MAHPVTRTGISRTAQPGGEGARKRIPEKVALVFEHTLDVIDERTIQDLSRLFNPQDTEISLVHAMPDAITGLPVDMPRNGDKTLTLGQYISEQERTYRECRERLGALMGQFGFRVAHEYVCSMREQNLQSIIEQIHESQKDLLVLCGSHFPVSGMIRNQFFMNLATHATIPVLLLKKHFMAARREDIGGKLHVLFGVDDSESSMLATRKLGELLRPEAVALTLATVQSPIYQENAVLAPFVNQDVLDEAMDNNAKMIFEMVCDLLEEQDLSVRDCCKLTGSPATELGFWAEQENPDLVVVGSHNRKGMMAWLMGSVSSQLLHWGTHNLLIIR